MPTYICLIREGVKIRKCNLEVHFKGPHFAQVINPFLDFYQTSFDDKTYKSSHQTDFSLKRLEYRTSGHLTHTFTVCTENPA